MRDLTVEAAPVEGTAPSTKFGMFLGVYTPSVLTILGVIMYQRLGWVVGHGGLWGALAVVGLAHVISLTTGLSVASIATNRAVKTGGNYYIISRSLGLSIGGAIGLALYIALALGVSLYLIGFAEAFIAATGYQPLGLDYKNSLRLIGTVACIAISVLTLYSTSIALKSQLFVLAAIIVSIIAIFFGTEVPAITGESAVGTWTFEKESFGAVFAVFFPAVTGFTAGVGMSGDLRDPKRAIPIGTMLAIITGLGIYVALPLFMVQMATTEQYQTNNNILLSIALNPWMVTAGVFAATLSSALGSILGAPRTLQALAFDGIVPRFLARGREEPRIALGVTILIALGGILVGELEVIGRILSMFFLTCYGFLCLACGLERWASSDFRPSFKVPVWVSLLGAAACFMVMFQIDPMFMFVSILIMGVLYLVLKRRQLVLGSGDTWGGVWSAVVRLGLMKLRSSESRELIRNWRPNMIVLARARTRRDLIDFGRTIVGDRGILTHFDLIRGGPTKATVDAALEDEYPGMFARTQGCDDVFDAVPGLASNYGMAGMETNAIMVGWPRDSVPNERYGRMVERLIALDVSVLMLRFDPDVGFGRREKIDVWWDGVSAAGQLMMTLSHLLHTSPQWKNAKIRVLVNGRRGSDEAAVTKRLQQTISEARVRAEPVLLAPLAEENMLAERVRQESAHADLVMIQVATPAHGDLVLENDRLIRPLGTALLIHGASTFEGEAGIFDVPSATMNLPRMTEPELALDMPADPVLALVVANFENKLTEALERFVKAVQRPAIDEEKTFIEEIVAEIEQIRQLERRLGRRGNRREGARGLVDWARQRFNTAVYERIQKFVAENTSRKVGEDVLFETAWERRLREGVTRLRQDIADLLMELPPTVSVPTEPDDWAPNENDPGWFRRLKFRTRFYMKLGMRPPARRIMVRDVAAQHLGATFNPQLSAAISKIGTRRFDAMRRVRRLLKDVERFFSNLLAELDQSVEPTVDMEAFKALVMKEAVGIEDVAFAVLHRFESRAEHANSAVRAVMLLAAHETVDEMQRPEAAHSSPDSATSKEIKAGRKAGQAMAELPGLWSQQHENLAQAMLLDVRVETLTVEVRRSLQQLFHRVRREIELGPLTRMKSAVEIMQRVVALREQQEQLNTGDIDDEENQGSDPPEEAQKSGPPKKKPTARSTSSSGREKPADESGDLEAAEQLKQEFISAADELRATLEEPYRPSQRELIDQLLVGLGRATERLPTSVTTMSERSLDQAAEGHLERAEVSYPARRLAQAFLEKSIMQPTRSTVAQLPDRVQASESVLADAVRLVTFELEQAAGVSAEDERDDLGLEDHGALALGGMLEERIRRLEAAKGALETYLSEFRRALLEEMVRSLDEARDAVMGSGVSGNNPQGLGLARADVVPRISAAIRRLEGQLGQAVDKIAERDEAKKARRTLVPISGTLADDVLGLRERLLPNPEIQASLPLIYRRIFGRAPLETTDLLRGREVQIDGLSRIVDRWKAGTGGPIAIIGDPRSGRSSLANIVARELLSDRSVFRVLPEVGGSADSEALNASLAKAVGAREGQSAESALRSLAPGSVLLIDDLGRWVERSATGLAALSLWLRLWRRFGERHLFVLTSTPYAWTYADQLLGIAECFVGTTSCAPVSFVALKQILALRQRTSDFALTFGAQDDRGAFRKALYYGESAQLKRLHERSRGNVGDALDLWRRSIVDVTERRITLSVGPEPDMSVMSRLPLRWYAALAAVSLHRTVSAARMARIMRMSREDAHGLLKDLERAGLLSADRSGAWALDPVLLPHVLRTMRQRGIIT